MTTVACGEDPTSTVIPRDLTNARVRARRNAGVVNSLYVYTQDRLSNVIVGRYRAAAEMRQDEVDGIAVVHRRRNRKNPCKVSRLRVS